MRSFSRCMCMSEKPGMSHLPRPSMRAHSLGNARRRRGCDGRNAAVPDRHRHIGERRGFGRHRQDRDVGDRNRLGNGRRFGKTIATYQQQRRCDSTRHGNPRSCDGLETPGGRSGLRCEARFREQVGSIRRNIHMRSACSLFRRDVNDAPTRLLVARVYVARTHCAFISQPGIPARSEGPLMKSFTPLLLGLATSLQRRAQHRPPLSSTRISRYARS